MNKTTRQRFYVLKYGSFLFWFPFFVFVLGMPANLHPHSLPPFTLPSPLVGWVGRWAGWCPLPAPSLARLPDVPLPFACPLAPLPCLTVWDSAAFTQVMMDSSWWGGELPLPWTLNRIVVTLDQCPVVGGWVTLHPLLCLGTFAPTPFPATPCLPHPLCTCCTLHGGMPFPHLPSPRPSPYLPCPQPHLPPPCPLASCSHCLFLALTPCCALPHPSLPACALCPPAALVNRFQHLPSLVDSVGGGGGGWGMPLPRRNYIPTLGMAAACPLL